jgi:hypothetical protein
VQDSGGFRVPDYNSPTLWDEGARIDDAVVECVGHSVQFCAQGRLRVLERVEVGLM